MLNKLFIGLLLGLMCMQWGFAELRDPTRPVNFIDQGSGKGGMRVDSIISSESRQAALVNGRWVSVGDNVDGKEVTRITADSVQFKTGDKYMVVSVEEQPVKQLSVRGTS